MRLQTKIFRVLNTVIFIKHLYCARSGNEQIIHLLYRLCHCGHNEYCMYVSPKKRLTDWHNIDKCKSSPNKPTCRGWRVIVTSRETWKRRQIVGTAARWRRLFITREAINALRRRRRHGEVGQAECRCWAKNRKVNSSLPRTPIPTYSPCVCWTSTLSRTPTEWRSLFAPLGQPPKTAICSWKCPFQVSYDTTLTLCPLVPSYIRSTIGLWSTKWRCIWKHLK